MLIYPPPVPYANNTKLMHYLTTRQAGSYYSPVNISMARPLESPAISAQPDGTAAA